MSTITTQKHGPIFSQLNEYICERHNAHESEALLQLAVNYLNQIESSENLTVADIYCSVQTCQQFIQRFPKPESDHDEWQTRLRQRGGEAVSRYHFPSAYREHFNIDDALADIALIKSLDSQKSLSSRFSGVTTSTTTHLQFKVISASESLVLSDIVPMLENLGVLVVSEHPYLIYCDNGHRFWLHDFFLSTKVGTVPESHNLELFRECFDANWRGEAENDAFNRLVLSAGITWRQVSVLRSYARYLRQTRFGFSQHFIAEALVNQWNISKQR